MWPTSRGEGDPSVVKVGNPKKLAPRDLLEVLMCFPRFAGKTFGG